MRPDVAQLMYAGSGLVKGCMLRLATAKGSKTPSNVGLMCVQKGNPGKPLDTSAGSVCVCVCALCVKIGGVV